MKINIQDESLLNEQELKTKKIINDYIYNFIFSKIDYDVIYDDDDKLIFNGLLNNLMNELKNKYLFFDWKLHDKCYLLINPNEYAYFFCIIVNYYINISYIVYPSKNKILILNIKNLNNIFTL